jgi:hypothetical protein
MIIIANHNWTKTHGFFALMGGFTVHRNDGRSHPIALADLEGHLMAGRITITEKEIEDRSKGNVLSRGAVLVQTGWFMLQLLARSIQRLPITELEIATLAFASLSLTIYVVWWNKPLDVQCSIVLTVPCPDTSVSVALAANQAPGETDRAEEVEIQTIPRSVPCPDTSVSVALAANQAPGETDRAEEAEIQTIPRSVADHASQEIGQVSEEVGQASEGINLVAEGVNPASERIDSVSEGANLVSEGTTHAPGTHPESPNTTLININFRQVLLLGAAAAGTRLWDIFAKAAGGTRKGISQLFEDLIARGLGDARLETFFADNQRVPTFYWGTDLTDNTYESFKRRRMRPLVALAGTVFGGIHCLAWPFGMPSEAEKVLWRVTACLITTIPLPFALAVAATDNGGVFRSRYGLIQPFIAGTLVLYAIARLSLLVQAFVLLRTLPEGAYTEVQWTSYIPHI